MAQPLHLGVALEGAGWHPAAWRELTAGAFELHVFAGGHFYLYADEEAFFAVVRRTLRPLLPVAPRAA